MKISAWQKSIGNTVRLVTNYDDTPIYDKLFVSKVFTDTEVPESMLNLPNAEYGGTGFFYDKAPRLSNDVEHMMPDYHLYDEWVEEKLAQGGKRGDYEYYLDYSIGFLTRGCFRQCSFCVNQNYTQCLAHSPVSEFFDPDRPKLCFLDDNFFACPQWKSIISEVKETHRPFQFKQGLDARLLTDGKIKEILEWRYDGDLIFAFDDINEREVVEEKLRKIYSITPAWKKVLKFYVLCGYDRNGIYNDAFWIQDIRDTFERIQILAKYSALPYIMRYKECYSSKYSGIYSMIAMWCNMPSRFKRFSFEMCCKCKGMGSKYKIYQRDTDRYLSDGNKKLVSWGYYDYLDSIAPDITKQYAHFTPSEIAEFGPDSMRAKLLRASKTD